MLELLLTLYDTYMSMSVHFGTDARREARSKSSIAHCAMYVSSMCATCYMCGCTMNGHGYMYMYVCRVLPEDVVLVFVLGTGAFHGTGTDP